MKKLLNPIEFYNDRKLLIANLIIFVVGTALAVLMKAWFSNNFSVMFRTDLNAYKTITENIIAILITAFVFFIAGKIVNKKTRLIDCFNLSFVIRIPSYILSLTNIIDTHSRNFLEIDKDGSISFSSSLSSTDIIILNITQILNIIVIIYFIVLIYQSFKTISNSKKASHFLILVILIIISIIITTTLFKNL